MTSPESWEQLFQPVQGNVPGSTKQQPAKETYEELAQKTEFARKRYSSDVAVGLGAVDTGEDFDPWAWLFNWSSTRTNNEAQAQADIIALNGRVTALEGGGTVTTYTVTGTWTNPSPSEHVAIKVICVNGGDGGGRGGNLVYDQQKGGQSGGYMQKTLYTDELPSTVAMTIGAAGAGATSAGSGGVGGTTSFGSYVVGLKGIGAIYLDGSYTTGVPPGDGGNGVWRDTGDNIYMPSTNGTGGPFAPGGRAGFGTSSGAVTGKAGSAAPVNIPSGGGGGGGGSVGSTGLTVVVGVGGVGGFPGGAGGAGARNGTTYANGANGAAGCIYIIEGAA